jgi:predicted nucleic acid-binding protein
VLFDTNVVLDVLLAREPHGAVAAKLFALADTGSIEGLVSATTVTTVHYIAARSIGAERAADCLRDVLAIFDVAGVDRAVLESALDSGFADYEDAVQHEAARAAGAVAIVTRNGADFAGSDLPVFAPHELLAAVLAANPE